MDDLSGVDLCLVETTEDVFEFKRWLGERRPVLGADTETGANPFQAHEKGALFWWENHMRLVQFGDANSGWAIPWADWGGLVREVFDRYDSSPIVFHNAKFDMHELLRAGVHVKRHLIDDTMIMHHLIDPPALHGLKPVSTELISPDAHIGQKALDEGMRKHSWNWGTVPINFEPYWTYSALDPILAARLYEKLMPQIQEKYSELYELELAVTWAMYDAEEKGIRVDVDYTRRYREELRGRWVELGAQGKKEFGVSLGSTSDVAARLEADGIPLLKLTDSGAKSLDKEVLEGLQGKHPLADLVLEFRRAAKFGTSYFESVLARLDGDRVHADIRTLGARTGRMSVSDPPFQQLPTRDKAVRRMIIPSEGSGLLSVDQSNIEVRLLAHFSQEPTMLQAFVDGLDVHWEMAKQMYPEVAHLNPDDDYLAAAARKKSKSGTLGRQYGIGARKFAIQQGVTVNEARSFLGAYNTQFEGVQEFIESVQETAAARLKDEGVAYVMTPAGRFQPLNRYEAADEAHYKLVNYLCQGHAADILKKAIVSIHQSEAGQYLVMPVHDEVILDVPEDVAADVYREVTEIMTDLTGYSVPLTTDAEWYTDSWADCVTYDKNKEVPWQTTT